MMLVQPTFQMRFLNFRNILGENLQSAFRVKIEMLVWRIHEFNVRAENCIPITPCTKLDKPKEKYEEIRIGRTQTKWEKIKIMCNGMDYKWVGNSDSNLPPFLNKISHFMVRFIIYYISFKKSEIGLLTKSHILYPTAVAQKFHDQPDLLLWKRWRIFSQGGGIWAKYMKYFWQGHMNIYTWFFLKTIYHRFQS